jgi:uncharacterized protein YjiS (DUF1127 family)
VIRLNLSFPSFSRTSSDNQIDRSTLSMTTNPNLSRENAFATADAVPSLGKRFVETVREWRHRARSRRALLAVDDRELRDIRLTRVDAEREARKPFWRE